MGDVTNIEFNTLDNQKVTFDDIAFSIKIPVSEPNNGDKSANDELKVQDVSLAPGESMELNIELDNETTNLMGWQCDIVLPAGLSLALKSNGKPAATLGSRFSTTEHTISSSRLANGAYRFIATSIDGEAIPGNSGPLFKVTLQADATVTPGTSLTGKVTNIEFNKQDNQKLTFNDVTFTVTIPGSVEKKCATPTITYNNGKLKFSCETPGVEYVSEVTSKETKKYYSDEVTLGGRYLVSVYATKAGYDDSDLATLEFTINGNGNICDVNVDGAVDVADIAAIIDEMAANARRLKMMTIHHVVR